MIRTVTRRQKTRVVNACMKDPSRVNRTLKRQYASRAGECAAKRTKGVRRKKFTDRLGEQSGEQPGPSTVTADLPYDSSK
ncbi:hypothetical protein HOLleu_26352 [Holothuria leucospilota]|uniref:Uncharacterized protein n=1 Tax=Holothuria leucospilota TaxID=206669 RepID=A0A9Q1BTV5_HOLLE|nr:hypothetical protein HOLleu_26352 [Holothuria leucospilota]